MTHARIAPMPAHRRSLFARLVRWFARVRFGRVPATLGVYEHSSQVLLAACAFELAYAKPRHLPQRLRALVDLKVAALVGCPFCLDIGSALAQGHGVTELQVRELHRHEDSDAFTQLERAALDFAVAVTQTPAVIDDVLFTRLRRELGDAAMVELSAAIAWENFRARMNHALGIEAQGFSQGGVCALPQANAAAPATARLGLLVERDHAIAAQKAVDELAT